MTTPQRRLLLIYPPMTLIFGAGFFFFHLLLDKVGFLPKSLFVYVPVILVAAAVIYAFYFRHRISSVNYKGAGPVTVATVYFMSMFAIPWTGLNLAALYTDRIQDVQSINDLPAASSAFVHIASFHVLPNRLIDEVITSEDKDDDGFMSYRFNYAGLVPMVATAQDSASNTWIEFTGLASVPHGMSGNEQQQFIDSMRQSNRNRVATFPYNRIAYFETVDGTGYSALLTQHNQPDEGQHIVHPYTESLSDRRIFFAKLWLWIYAGLSVFFAGAVAFGNYEPIEAGD